MPALPLLLLALTATSVVAEPTVYLREQFEDGGESFSPNDSLAAKPRLMNCQLHVYILPCRNIHMEANEWLTWLLCFVLHGGTIVLFALMPSARCL